MDLLNRNYFFFKASGGAGRSSSGKSSSLKPFKDKYDKSIAERNAFNAWKNKAKTLAERQDNITTAELKDRRKELKKLYKEYITIQKTPIKYKEVRRKKD